MCPDLQHQNHISSQFNADLEAIRQSVLKMGGVVEQQLLDATEALLNCNESLADDVILRGEEVDALEIAIDEASTLVLVKRQPTAGDLRMVIALTRVVTDLERIGDEAEKIARMSKALVGQPKLDGQMAETGHLARHVSKLIRDAFDALARFDTELALQVAEEDRVIDREYESVMRICLTYMMEDPRNIGRTMNIVWAVRSLERIGDHAKNVAEHVIYLVEGADVRHASLDEMAEAVRNPKSR